MMALLKCLAECGTTDLSAAPSLTCRCQSSGCVISRESAAALAATEGIATSAVAAPGSSVEAISSLGSRRASTALIVQMQLLYQQSTLLDGASDERRITMHGC